MTPPDVAALLALHPEPWTVGCLGGVYDADGVTVGGRDNGPSAATLVPALATALRAALADQRRLVEELANVEWYCAMSNSSASCPSCGAMEHHGHNATGCQLRELLDTFTDGDGNHKDAAMTAAGGGV